MYVCALAHGFYIFAEESHSTHTAPDKCKHRKKKRKTPIHPILALRFHHTYRSNGIEFHTTTLYTL